MHDEHRYDDMLKMKHHISKNHRQMPQLDRAAQFAPFAALTGYNESIMDASRRPEEKIELSETQSEELNARIALLAKQVNAHPIVAVRYYHIEEEKEHRKITSRHASSPDKTIPAKQKRIQDLQNETSVRKNAKGRREPVGSYITERKQLKKIDVEHQVLLFTDRTSICFSDLLSIDSALFSQLEEE